MSKQEKNLQKKLYFKEKFLDIHQACYFLSYKINGNCSPNDICKYVVSGYRLDNNTFRRLGVYLETPFLFKKTPSPNEMIEHKELENKLKEQGHKFIIKDNCSKAIFYDVFFNDGRFQEEPLFFKRTQLEALANLVNSPSKKALNSIKETPTLTKPVSRLEQQEDAILNAIQELGQDPYNLPPQPTGKAGIKSIIKKILNDKEPFTATTAFNRTWGRLFHGDDAVTKRQNPEKSSANNLNKKKLV